MALNTSLLRTSDERIGDAIVVHAAGEVDLLGAPVLEEHLERVYPTARPPQIVVADLTEVGFLGSAGIAVLLHIGRRCKDQGTPLRVVATRPATIEPLRTTGVDQVLVVADSLASVIRSA